MKACNETIVERLERARGEMGNDLVATVTGSLKEFLSFTGECGVMLKVYLVACFCGEGVNGEPLEDLPTFWSMPCTASAQAGVSSKRCTKCYCYGICPNWHDFVQEIKRVNRLLCAESGSNCYYNYLNVSTF